MQEKFIGEETFAKFAGEDKLTVGFEFYLRFGAVSKPPPVTISEEIFVM